MAVHVDIIAELQERSVRRAADRLEQQFNNINAEVGVDVKAAEIKAAAAKIQREFHDIRQEIKIDVDDASIRRATRSMGEMRQEGSRLDSLIQEIGTTAFRTSRGLMALAGPPVLKGLVDLASVSVTASQSIALLPAIAAAGGAAMGTLALATSGVGDTLDTVFDPKKRQDPEKFAAAIQSLSPAAQQAVLSIKALVPQFDALKNATQDTFFAGIGDQIQNLSKIYLPQVQTLTTGIAGAFNQALAGIGNQLATPGAQAQIKTTIDNIVLGFQNAAPAAQSFSQALLDITEVGSEFLPGFGTGIANAAQEFANFIREARESGQLKIWIQEGIDAAKALGNGLIELTKFIYEAFGSDAQGNIKRFTDDIHTISEAIKLVSGDGEQWSISWNEELDSMYGPLGKLRDGIMDIPEALAFVGNAAIDMANTVKHAIDGMLTNLVTDLNHMADILPDRANKLLFGTEHPKPFSFTPSPDIPRLPSGGDWSGHQMPIFGTPGWGGTTVTGPNGPHQVGGVPPGPTIAVAPGQNRTSRPNPPGLPGPPGGSIFGVPAAPPTGPGGKKPSDKERRDAIAAGLDPNSYRIDPFAQVPGLPPGVAPLPKGAQGPMGMATGTPYGGGTYTQDPQKILEAQHAVESAGHDLEEARKDRLVLEKDNQASAQDISNAKWKETEAGWKLQSQQADLAAAIQGTYDKTSDASSSLASAMGELGAGLDKDLGISKGLPGLADNLVRFLGNLALAPAMAQMAMTKATSPSQGGYGLMGILGAQGAFGPQFTGLDQDRQSTTGGSTGTSQYTSTDASQYTGGGLPGAADAAVRSQAGAPRPGESARDFAHRVMMPFWQSQGLQVGDHAADQYGEHQQGALDIMVPDIATGSNVLQQVLSDPNVYGAIFNNQTFGYGHGTTPQDYSAGHTGDPSQDHLNHVHAFYKPGGANNITPTGAPGGTSGGYQQLGSTPFGSIPIPLPVTIVGGGAGGGGAVPVTLPGMPGGGGGASLWDQVMPHEGGTWDNPDTGGTGHYGGLQFAPSTWKTYGGVGMPQDATREQQIEIANRTAFTGYNGTPPQGLSAWEAITNGSVPGVSVNTPASSFMGGGGWAGPGISPDQTGGGGQNPLFNPTPGPMAGGGAGAGLLPGAAPPMAGSAAGTRIGGLAPIAPNPGGGGVGITPGGSIDTAADLAAMAFPGVGQAAATGMKLASRAMQYAGQVAGIGVSGLLETFLPTGGSELANNNWLTRLAGAAAGAAPALPNIAGGMAGKAQMQGQPPVNPNDVSTGQGAGAPPGPNINLNYTNNGATEDRAGADITNHLRTQYTPPGRR